MNLPLSMTINGKAMEASVDPRTLLVQFLREQLQLTGAHVGCDTAQCRRRFASATGCSAVSAPPAW